MKDWRGLKKLLCIRLDNMGDVIMTSPAIRALKEGAPGRHITLLTSTVASAAAEHIPQVDKVVLFDAPWVKKDSSVDSRRLFELADKLSEEGFEGAVIFNAYSQSPLPAAALCYLAGIPHVLGYCRENPYKLINSWMPDPEPTELIRHEVERQLELVAQVGSVTKDRRLIFEVRPEDMDRAGEILRRCVPGRQRWLVMHPGVSEEKRRFPAEKFIAAGKLLIADGWRIILSGSRSERTYVEKVKSGLGGDAVNTAGELSISELAALIKKAEVLVANNTGPVHVAAAVGTPVVVAYAKTNPQHTPWEVPSSVLYFEVPEDLRSKNVLLNYFPGEDLSPATPAAIARAVKELTGGL